MGENLTQMGVYMTRAASPKRLAAVDVAAPVLVCQYCRASGHPARDLGSSNEEGGSLPAMQNAARRRTEVNALCFAPDFCTEKPQCFQAGDFRAKFLQTVWKRRRIEDGRAWWGFWLVFAIFCPKLLLTLLALSGPP
jgi:hypothetical protein